MQKSQKIQIHAFMGFLFELSHPNSKPIIQPISNPEKLRETCSKFQTLYILDKQSKAKQSWHDIAATQLCCPREQQVQLLFQWGRFYKNK